jgi:hypothetical protein
MLGRYLDHRLDAEGVELIHPRASAFVIGLVDREQNGHAQRPEATRDLFVARHESLAPIDDEHDDVRAFQGFEPVMDDKLVKRVLGMAKEPARIDQREPALRPLGRRRQSVTGGARYRRDDRPACAGDAIEEGRLPDVGTTDEDYGRAVRIHSH